MEGLKMLTSLPIDIKKSIVQEFGSIETLYKKVFDLNAEDYGLHMNKPKGYQSRQQAINSELLDIEDKLEELGLDGRDVTSEISSDHGEIIVNRRVQDLDNYLRQIGTDYETIKAWLKNSYGI